MKKLYFLLTAFSLVLSCSSDETSTPVTPPPAPIAKYTITLSAGEGGTVSTTGGEYEAGQTVSVTATPQGEYLFKDWSDGNTNATRTITANSNTTLTANFEKKKYQLTVNIEGEGEVLEEIVNTGRTTDYDSGTTVKLTAVPAEGWEFIGWTGTIESTELEVQLLVSEAKEVNAFFNFVSQPFKSLTENFSPINKTTSWYKENEYFKYYTYINDENYLKIRVDESVDEFLYWRPLSENMIYGDFNGDQKVDLFIFMNKVDMQGFGFSGPGKYVIYSDVYKEGFNFSNPEIIAETEVVFAGNIIIQDFDNDGVNDILIGPYQNHNNKTLPLIRPKILYFNKDFSFEEIDFGFVSNQHSISAGDINNDGLIDIVQIGHVGTDDNLEDANFPNSWINLGARNFNKIELIKEIDQFKNDWDQFNISYYDLFDLNNDGHLDILCGNLLVKDKWVDLRYQYNDKFFHESMEGPFILWGDGSGQYSIENITYNENLSFPYDSQVGFVQIMGGGFSDFDKDGDIDFIISAELQDYNVSRNDLTGRNYDNYIIQLYENKGTNEFVDVTKEKVTGYYKFNPYEFTWFKRLSSIDKDGDGDYDLVPRSFNGVYNLNTESWNTLFDDLYWENVGGNFIRREYN